MWVIRGTQVGEATGHDGYPTALRTAEICANLSDHAKGPSRAAEPRPDTCDWPTLDGQGLKMSLVIMEK